MTVDLTVWPLADVLTKTATWLEHLQQGHDCDAHGYEELSFLIPAARQHARASIPVPTQDQDLGEGREGTVDSSTAIPKDTQAVVAEIRERANDAGLVSYDLTREVPTVCQLCSGAMDDHKGDCLLADLHTLLGIVDQLSQPVSGDDGGEDNPPASETEIAVDICEEWRASSPDGSRMNRNQLARLAKTVASALTAARDEEKERAAKIQFASVVPVDQVWIVAIGSLGLKLYESKSDAEQCCGAINFAIAAAIRAPHSPSDVVVSVPDEQRVKATLVEALSASGRTNHENHKAYYASFVEADGLDVDGLAKFEACPSPMCHSVRTALSLAKPDTVTTKADTHSVDTPAGTLPHLPESPYSRHNHLGGFSAECAECNPLEPVSPPDTTPAQRIAELESALATSVDNERALAFEIAMSEVSAKQMQRLCIKKVREMRDKWKAGTESHAREDPYREYCRASMCAANGIITALESITPETSEGEK